MANQLLATRQSQMLTLLTNPSLLDGGNTDTGGISLPSLRKVAELALSKRIGKIRILMPATFKFLHSNLNVIQKLFASEFPQRSANGLKNARDFQQFIQSCDSVVLQFPHLPDLMEVELAIAEAKGDGGGPKAPSQIAFSDLRGITLKRAVLRRTPTVKMVRVGFDLKGVLGDQVVRVVTSRNEGVFLLIIPSRSKGLPRIFEVTKQVWIGIGMMNSWQLLGDVSSRLPEVYESAAELNEIGAIELSVR